jgi:hypothetical protein
VLQSLIAVLFAHIAGVPVEETLPALGPAFVVVAMSVRATIARLRARRRRP